MIKAQQLEHGLILNGNIPAEKGDYLVEITPKDKRVISRQDFANKYIKIKNLGDGWAHYEERSKIESKKTKEKPKEETTEKKNEDTEVDNESSRKESTDPKMISPQVVLLTIIDTLFEKGIVTPEEFNKAVQIRNKQGI